MFCWGRRSQIASRLASAYLGSGCLPRPKSAWWGRVGSMRPWWWGKNVSRGVGDCTDWKRGILGVLLFSAVVVSWEPKSTMAFISDRSKGLIHHCSRLDRTTNVFRYSGGRCARLCFWVVSCLSRNASRGSATKHLRLWNLAHDCQVGGDKAGSWFYDDFIGAISFRGDSKRNCSFASHQFDPN